MNFSITKHKLFGLYLALEHLDHEEPAPGSHVFEPTLGLTYVHGQMLLHM